jgi:hypothetical protein
MASTDRMNRHALQRGLPRRIFQHAASGPAQLILIETMHAMTRTPSITLAAYAADEFPDSIAF